MESDKSSSSRNSHFLRKQVNFPLEGTGKLKGEMTNLHVAQQAQTPQLWILQEFSKDRPQGRQCKGGTALFCSVLPCSVVP